MKGFVPTPTHLVDVMVEKLFRDRLPSKTDRLLDPGCGTGAFIQGVLRWATRTGNSIPQIVGIESDPKLYEEAKLRVGGSANVTLYCEDFLTAHAEQFEYIVGNPPYVPITGLTIEERTKYRKRYLCARGRFDLYLLFFEQALGMLKPNGRLVFVTPEKFLYVQSAKPLRSALAAIDVEEIDLIDESAFGDLVTYPTITTAIRRPHRSTTRVSLRDRTTRTVNLQNGHDSWLPVLQGNAASEPGPVLSDQFLRISCGVATGADDIYVLNDEDVPLSLKRFAYPTISGRQMVQGARVDTTQSMLIPYLKHGALFDESMLGALGDYLSEPSRRVRLMARTCVARKPWYAFHETPPLDEILRPKILCKDIGSRPWFVVDETGDIVPRHSVYYLVPRESANINDLCEYLNSDAALTWLMAHCQRAANGFVRLQSHVLKRMPLPQALLTNLQLAAV